MQGVRGQGAERLGGPEWACCLRACLGVMPEKEAGDEHGQPLWCRTHCALPRTSSSNATLHSLPETHPSGLLLALLLCIQFSGSLLLLPPHVPMPTEATWLISGQLLMAPRVPDLLQFQQ